MNIKTLMAILFTTTLVSGCVVVEIGMEEEEGVEQSAAAVATQNTGGSTGEVARLLNSDRSKAGKPALVQVAALNTAAQRHAQDMAQNANFSHIGTNGTKPAQRVANAGYRACYVAENIAAGQPSAGAVMNAWRKSAGHNRNNLSSKPVHFGVGMSNANWVVVFTSPC